MDKSSKSSRKRKGKKKKSSRDDRKQTTGDPDGKKKERSLNMSLRQPKSKDNHDKVNDKALNEFMELIGKLGATGCCKQFNELKNFEPDNKKCDAFFANPTKNRYMDVLCLDETRVHLRENRNDYIHANWVKLDGIDRVYIATQGPLDETIEDFWKMCFDEGVSTIIMLCKTEEEGKKKCAQYYPLDDNGFKTFGKMFVNNKKVENDDKFTIYTLEVLPEGCSNSNIIKLFHLTSWPDRGVALSARTVLRLMQAVSNTDKLATGPVVCHCSAGIGRTGTVIMINWLMHALFTKGEFTDPGELLKKLRAQRLSSVQTEGQWLFMYSSIVDYIAIKRPKHADQCKAFLAAVAEKKLNSD